MKKIFQYIGMLDEWNEKYNLVSYKSIEELCKKHIIDSLSLIEALDLDKKIIGDIGTGCGLPGIVLALLYPNSRFILIEPKRKYFYFIKKVIDKLKIKNIKLINKKVEYVTNLGEYDIILSRAVGSIEFFYQLKNIKKRNLIILYKGEKIFKELSENSYDGWEIVFIKKIKLLEMYNINHYIIGFKMNISIA